MSVVLSFDIGIKNLAYCLFTYNPKEEFEFDILEWNILDVSIPQKTNVLDKQSDKLFSILHETFGDKEIHYVVIENQPVLKNPVMKTIQMMVYSYFKMNKMLQEEINTVCLVNAGNKLKFAFNVIYPYITKQTNEFDDLQNTIINPKNKYKETKTASIQYVKSLLTLKDLSKHLQYFNNFKKKDDLADTLLQGLYFSYTHIEQ